MPAGRQQAPEEAETWVHTAWCCCFLQAVEGGELPGGEKSFAGQKSRAHCMQSSLTVVLNLGKRLSRFASPCLEEAHCGFSQVD